jgi:hypothetical protein
MQNTWININFLFNQYSLNKIWIIKIKSEKNSLCLDTLGKEKINERISLFYCQTKGSNNQLFSLTSLGQLRKEVNFSFKIGFFYWFYNQKSYFINLIYEIF